MRLVWASLAIAAALTGAAQAQYIYYPGFTPTPTKLECRMGPILKTFAGTEWEVRGCDERTINLFATKDNPLYPYFFTVRPDVIGWDVYGVGLPAAVAPRTEPWDKTIVEAVRKDLKTLRGKQVDALIAEATAAHVDPPSDPDGK